MKTLTGLAFCGLLGVCIALQGWTALLWAPLGFAVGLFVTAQMVLPIMLGLPRAIRLVARKQMRPAVFGAIILTPAIWLVFLGVVTFLVGWFWPKTVEYLYNNTGLNLGTNLGIIAIVLSPLSEEARSDFRHDFDIAYSRFYRDGRYEKETDPAAAEYGNDLVASSEHSETPRMSEEEAVDIAVDFGTAYADCNDERLVFKPISRLPATVDTVVQAMKVSYQMGYPLPDPLESSYKFCYPQVGFFVSDEDFEQARAYFSRLNATLLTDQYHPTHSDYSNAIANLNSAPNIASLQESIEGQSTSVAELVKYLDDFFQHEFLAKAPDDIDREWVKRLAQTCWLKMRFLIDDWDAFRGLVRTGDSGLESKELALARIRMNELKREIDAMDANLGSSTPG